jgi:hypothetical protein
MRDGLFAPVSAVDERPIVASSLAGGRWAATMFVIGTRFVQSQGGATDATCVVLPSTCKPLGSGCTRDALPSTVKLLTWAVPPRNRLPRTVPGDDALRFPGVAKSPPMVTPFDQT